MPIALIPPRNAHFADSSCSQMPKSAWVFQNLLDTSHPEFGMAVGTTPEEAKYLPRASLPTNIDLRT